MYTHIIDFCLRALEWYHKAGGGFFKKAFAAIKDPWSLEFEDVVQQIKQTNARVREQAIIAHQAETRHISLKISDVQLEVMNLRKDNKDLRSLMVSGPAHPAIGKRSSSGHHSDYKVGIQSMNSLADTSSQFTRFLYFRQDSLQLCRAFPSSPRKCQNISCLSPSTPRRL